MAFRTGTGYGLWHARDPLSSPPWRPHDRPVSGGLAANAKPCILDIRSVLVQFAVKYTKSLERQIAAEQRSSEERLELRKRAYGDLEDNGS